MKTKPLDELEMFEVLELCYPEKFNGDDDATFDAAMDFADNLSGFDQLADLLGRVVMLTMPMESGITKRYSHCLGSIRHVKGNIQMVSAVRRDFMHDESKEL